MNALSYCVNRDVIGFKAGAAAFLAKPYTISDLFAIVQQYVVNN